MYIFSLQKRFSKKNYKDIINPKLKEFSDKLKDKYLKYTYL